MAFDPGRRAAGLIAAVERSIAHNPEVVPAHVFLAACHGHLGEEALAREAVAEARRLSPDVSIAWARTVFAYRRAADLDLLIEGLRKAGLGD